MVPEPVWSEYFSGGVPAANYFHMILDELREICNETKEEKGINRRFELVFIGLLSYFEAFCKNQFESILNIEPKLLESLKARGQDTTIDANDIILYGDNFPIRIGFVVSEKYDFGSSKKINSLYNALLNISPFNKDETYQYDNLLRDRNLIVHHGGVYTLTHLKQNRFPSNVIKEDAFFNSVTFSRKDLLGHIDFIASIAKKITITSHRAIIEFHKKNNIEIFGELKQAVEHIGWW